MELNVYCAHSLRTDVEQPKTIRALNDPQHQKLTTTSRKLVYWKCKSHLWKSKSCMLRQDNAPAHSALCVKAFFAKYSMTMLDYPSYSPHLASYDFFPKVKSELRVQELTVWKRWKQKWRRFWISWQKRTSTTALNNEKFVRSFVGIGMESTLNAINFVK